MSSDGELTSDSSQSSLSSVSDDAEISIPVGVIEPYQFEPEYSTSSEGDAESGEEDAHEEAEAGEDRRANLDW